MHQTETENYYATEISLDEAMSICPYLRKEDIQEMRAGFLMLPDEEEIDLLRKIMGSNYEASTKVFGAFKQGESIPFAVFGVSSWSTQPDIGVVWMHGTDVIEEAKTTFLRQSRLWLDVLASGFNGLFCASDSRNTVHHRWLIWLGFTEGQTYPAGVDGENFTSFMRM